MTRARVVPGLLAALGTLVASWPLTTLLDDGSWVRPVLLLLLLQAGIGMAGRYAGWRTWATATVQVVTVVLAVLALHVGDTLVPTAWDELPFAVNDLLLDARETLTTYSAPAPLSPGVLFVLSLTLPLVGVVVDVLAAGLRMPAAAGLPLLGIFLFSTSNSGEALNPVYFLALAVVWLVLLLQQGMNQVSTWSSTEAFARTPERQEDRLGLGAFSATARWMGLVTLVIALALPAVIPHLPPRYLADGLAQRTGSSDVASVGFTDTLDLSTDLNSDNQTPILTYATTDSNPPPLKVLTLSSYAGGQWVREDPPRTVTGRDNARMPDPIGMDSETPRRLERINVVGNGLTQPYIASPWPVEQANMQGSPWYYDPAGVQPRVRERTSAYSTTYKVLADDARPGDGPVISQVDPLTLRTDPRATAQITAANAAALEGVDDNDTFGKAVAMQDWLRDPSRFTYSLQLAPTQNGPDGQPYDPLSNFLVTRRGYCTQFSTAMIMMARAEGIPARMAVGFLPGSPAENGNLQVRAADAHSWPELYFPGMGWTRFEPTPGVRSGEVPAYTLPQADEAATRATRTTAQPSESSAAPQTSAAPTASPSAAPQAAGEGRDWFPVWLRWLLLAVILGGAGAMVLPLAARWRRDQDLRAAAEPRDHVEAEWSALESRLHDLGIDSPGERSPRQLEKHYRQRAPLEAEGKEALHRAVQTLERARYASPAGEPPTLQQDADRIVREVREQSSLPTRVSAVAFPATGRRALAEGVRRVAGAPGRAARRGYDRLTQRRRG